MASLRVTVNASATGARSPAVSGVSKKPCRVSMAAPAARLSSSAHMRGSAGALVSAPAARLHQRGAAVAARSMLTTKDESSGVEYPMVTRLWAGDEYRSLGAASLSKTSWFFFSSSVYSITCYVEAEKAAKELGVRYRGGFFETEQDFCDAIMDGAFGKAFQITLLQDDLVEQLAETIEEAIAPRMRLMQQSSVMEEVLDYLRSRSDALTKGANLVLFFTQTGSLNMAIKGPSGEEEVSGTVNWLSGVPEKSIDNNSLCRALLEVWLGESDSVPGSKPVFAAGARALLESENIRRETRKGGS